MRSFWRPLLFFILVFVLGIGAGYVFLSRSLSLPKYGCNPKEVNVICDSLYAYHLELYQKLVHVQLADHEIVAWTFDRDTTVDSVTAVFGSGTPFASAHFSFGDSAAFSGAPVVGAGPTIYNYTLTVYPHSHAPVTVDPGIIVE